MVYIYQYPLPGYCHEMVGENPDGSHTILINSLLSRPQQLKAYEHAMHHILNDDFRKDSVQTIEYEAHKEGDL